VHVSLAFINCNAAPFHALHRKPKVPGTNTSTLLFEESFASLCFQLSNTLLAFRHHAFPQELDELAGCAPQAHAFIM
jgi:hypothetical protein